jgi:5-methylcytosine-specific restriction protein A
VFVNAYERNPAARAACIAHYGLPCVVCGFNFGAVYGWLADGFTYVHHLKPLSEIREEYEVDPIADSRMVCANCHALIHLGGGCRSIEEARCLVDPRVLAFWASFAEAAAAAVRPRD